MQEVGEVKTVAIVADVTISPIAAKLALSNASMLRHDQPVAFEPQECQLWVVASPAPVSLPEPSFIVAPRESRLGCHVH